MASVSQGFSRRRMLQWLAIGTGATMVAACAPAGSPQGNQTGGEGSAAETQELRLLVCCYTDSETKLREAFNEQYKAARSGVTIDMELLAGGQNYFEKLQTQIAAGTMPDLYDMWEGYIQPYAQNGALVNMDPYLESDAKIKRDDLVPAAVDAATWEGSIYALLIGFMPGPASVYYNADHLSEAGIAEPDADWTWDDLRAMAQALVKGSGDMPDRYGLAFDLWFVPWTYWIWSNGGDIFNPDQSQSTLADPKAVEALQYWADLVNVDKSVVPTDSIRQMQGGINALKTGATSLFLGNTWDVATLKETPDLNWKAVLSPKANAGTRTWYEHTWCWGISTQSKQPAAAWEFAREFVLNRVIDPATPTIPPLKQLLDQFDTETNRQLGYTPLITLANEPNQFRIPGAGAKWDKISGLIQAELDLVFIGEKSAADAAATVVPQIDAELARS
ncbi:MAG: sugar ABC transporter substrate-binding protein [Caldilineaceae bacterium]|nr:sugar ABC transporter substrate-binding protein [Caldilineaceae bacterium]